MRTIVVIPARSGSRRFPNKNIALLGGKPLIYYSIKAALSASSVSEVLVSSDSVDIINIAKEIGAKVPVIRPKNISTHDSPIVCAVQHMVNNLDRKPECIVLFQPTSPLLNSDDIDNGVELLRKLNADSVTAVALTSTVEHPFNVRYEDKDQLLKFCNETLHAMPTEERPNIYKSAGMWFTRHKVLMEYNKLEGPRNYALLIDAPRFLDIDYEEDLKLIEAWMQYEENSRSDR